MHTTNTSYSVSEQGHTGSGYLGLEKLGDISCSDGVARVAAHWWDSAE